MLYYRSMYMNMLGLFIPLLMNIETAANILVLTVMLLWTYVPVSLAYLREFLCLSNGELLGYIHIFSLLETAKYFFNLHKYQQSMRVPVSLTWPSTLFKFRLFLFLTIIFFKTQNLIVNLNFPHCQWGWVFFQIFTGY